MTFDASRLPQHLLPAPDWSEGSWWSPAGYRSAATRARVMYVLLLVEGLVIVAMGLNYILRPDEFAATLRVVPGRMPSIDPIGLILGVLYVASLIGLAISMMMWIYRSVENCWYLLGGIPERSPGWSVGWWFIPGANLVMPLLVVWDLNRRMARGVASPMMPLLLVWWVIGPLIGIAGLVITFPISFQAALPPGPTLEEGRRLAFITGLFQLASVIPPILTLIVYGRIQRFADVRAQYALPPPPPIWGPPPGGWGPPPGPPPPGGWGAPPGQSGPPPGPPPSTGER